MSPSPSPSLAPSGPTWSLHWRQLPPDGLPISLEVNSRGRAYFHRGAIQAVQLKLSLSPPRLQKLSEQVMALPPGALAPLDSKGGASSEQLSVERDGGAPGQLKPSEGQALVESVKELVPRLYSEDKEQAWLCGRLTTGAERGAFVNVAPPGSQPKQYRLDPPPEMIQMGDCVVVTGQVDTQAVDIHNAGPTYTVVSWLRWEQLPNPKGTPTPSPSSSAHTGKETAPAATPESTLQGPQ